MTVSGNAAQQVVTQILNGRRPRRQSRQRRRPRPSNQSYSVRHPDDFNFSRFCTPENLFAAWESLRLGGGHGAGIDGLTFHDFGEPEAFAALQKLSRALRAGTWHPQEIRLVRVAKFTGGFRELCLQVLLDRTVSKSLLLALNPYWKRVLPGLGRGRLHIYAAIQRLMRERRGYVLASDDIQDCYPSIPVAPVIECHREQISSRTLMWLISTVLRGHEGRDRVIGLDQGSPYVPVAVELFLDNHLDTRLDAECQGFPKMFRYVDNVLVVAESIDEGHQALQFARNVLAEQSLTLKGQDGPPQDLRSGNWDRPVLGLIPRWQDGQMRFTIPDEAMNRQLESIFVTAASSGSGREDLYQGIECWLAANSPALIGEAALEVVDSVLRIGRRCGYPELKRQRLIQAARKERQRWLSVSSGAPVRS